MDISGLGPFRIGENGTFSHRQKWETSGSAQWGPIRVSIKGTLRIVTVHQDWWKWNPIDSAKMGPSRLVEKRIFLIVAVISSAYFAAGFAISNGDPSGLVKMGPFQIGKNGDLPNRRNWDPSDLRSFVVGEKTDRFEKLRLLHVRS